MPAGRDAVPAGVADTSTPPGGRRGKPCREKYRLSKVRPPITRKRTDAAMARRKTRTHPSLMRQTRRFRVARRSDPRDVPAKSGTCALRRAIPLFGGRKKKKDYGRTPAPSKEQEPAKRWLCTLSKRDKSIERRQGRSSPSPGGGRVGTEHA